MDLLVERTAREELLYMLDNNDAGIDWSSWESEYLWEKLTELEKLEILLKEEWYEKRDKQYYAGLEFALKEIKNIREGAYK